MKNDFLSIRTLTYDFSSMRSLTYDFSSLCRTFWHTEFPCVRCLAWWLFSTRIHSNCSYMVTLDYYFGQENANLYCKIHNNLSLGNFMTKNKKLILECTISTRKTYHSTKINEKYQWSQSMISTINKPSLAINFQYQTHIKHHFPLNISPLEQS